MGQALDIQGIDGHFTNPACCFELSFWPPLLGSVSNKHVTRPRVCYPTVDASMIPNPRVTYRLTRYHKSSWFPGKVPLTLRTWNATGRFSRSVTLTVVRLAARSSSWIRDRTTYSYSRCSPTGTRSASTHRMALHRPPPRIGSICLRTSRVNFRMTVVLMQLRARGSSTAAGHWWIGRVYRYRSPRHVVRFIMYQCQHVQQGFLYLALYIQLRPRT